jgi:hypothetical protein
VKPLVSEYVSTIAANAEVHRDLVSKYCLVDPEGQKLPADEYEVRRRCLCHQLTHLACCAQCWRLFSL